MWRTGLSAPRHVGSSWTRARARDLTTAPPGKSPQRPFMLALRVSTRRNTRLLSTHYARPWVGTKYHKMNESPGLLSGSSCNQSTSAQCAKHSTGAQGASCRNRAGTPEQPGGWGGVGGKLRRGADSPALKDEEARVRMEWDGGGRNQGE